jgi:hypothetical protein
MALTVPHLFSIILRIRFRWRQHHLCRKHRQSRRNLGHLTQTFISLPLYPFILWKYPCTELFKIIYFTGAQKCFSTLNTVSRKDKKFFFRRRNLRLSRLKILSRFGKRWGTVALAKQGRRRQWHSLLLVIYVYLSYVCDYMGTLCLSLRVRTIGTDFLFAAKRIWILYGWH